MSTNPVPKEPTTATKKNKAPVAKIQYLRQPMLVFGLVVLAIALIIMMRQTFSRNVPSIEPAVQTTEGGKFTLTSTAFEPGKPIPTLYTCSGANINPPFTIDNAPGNAKEFVLIMHDPDANNRDFTHWMLWDIPVNTTTIAEHTVPPGATQGTTDFGNSEYGGPCPTDGTGVHTYIFDLYALNDTLSLDTSTKKDELISAMNGKVLARTQLIGTVRAK